MKDYKEISKKSFNEDAEKLNLEESSEENKFFMKRESYDIVQEEVKKENFDDFLDIGCGIGNSIELLLKEFPESHFIGLDIAEKMIELAKKKKLSPEHTEFIIGDAENLPFDGHSPHQSFDVVICKETFHHFPHPEKFFTEVYRVLKPNGRFIIFDFATTEISRWIKNNITNSFSSHGICHHYNIQEVTDLYKNFNFEILRAENVTDDRMIVSGRKIIKEQTK
ncbi:putative methyltransferase type 11 [Anaeromyces robustus]|uniref:Putative methyltransferase type 11 n=1 Tax=Anaeromyces robustus TaxID=1754192 RepID=A0A1Y1X7Y4_9FUNG|nr:putative methyltransferase type 11 [Anaeromyces robustus]|eukprot:ORX81870.1 putative methyltransferase type 11 [Anaeromyces robustus]